MIDFSCSIKRFFLKWLWLGGLGYFFDIIIIVWFLWRRNIIIGVINGSDFCLVLLKNDCLLYSVYMIKMLCELWWN